MNPVRLYSRIYKKREAYFREWERYSGMVKRMAADLLGDVEVYVFGSVVKGEAHPILSDIDVLIVSSTLPESREERAKIKAKILRGLGPMNPFEIHLVTPKEAEWYKMFLKCELEKVD